MGFVVSFMLYFPMVCGLFAMILFVFYEMDMD